jgi:argininosuccinate lyase
MTLQIVQKIEVNKAILDNNCYDLMFSVEEVNRLALEGVPFRDAYKQVGIAIEKGEFVPQKTINHTHEGSMGNLCNEKIAELKTAVLKEFTFEKAEKAERDLVK